MYQNNRRRRARLSQERRTAPPAPNPPQTGLLAHYVSSMVRGTYGGQPVAQPPDGPLAAWASIAGTSGPLRAIDAAHQPELSAVEGGSGPVPIVMFDAGEVMVSPFSPPGGSAQRSMVFVGLASGAGRIVGYGSPAAGRAFGLVLAEDAYGWDFGGDPQASPAEADDNPHVVSLVTDGTAFSFNFDDMGTEPEAVALNTDPSWLTLGSAGANLGVLEVLVYDHVLDEDEAAALLAYLDELYHFGGGGGDDGVPGEGLVARFRAKQVYGNSAPVPQDSEVITGWVQWDDQTPPLANADAASRPVYLLRNGKPRVRFEPTKTLSGNFNLPTDGDPRSIVLMGVNWHTDPDQLFVQQGDPGVENGLFALGTAPTTGRAAAALDADTFLAETTTLNSGNHCLIVTYGASTVTLQLDDNEPLTLSASLATDGQGVTVGDALANFDAYEILFYDRALPPGDRDQILAYFDQEFDLPGTPPLPSSSLILDWRASSANGLDAAGVVKTLGANRKIQNFYPHKTATVGVFVQNTLAQRPEFHNTELPYVRFTSGSSMVSAVLLPSGTADRTIAFIAYGMQSPNQRLFHYGDMTTDGAGFGLVTDGSGTLAWSGGGSVGGTIGHTSDGMLHVVLISVGSGGTQVGVRVDYEAAVYFNGLSLNTVSDPITLGSASAAPEFALIHLLAFNGVLTGPEQSQVVEFSHVVYGAPVPPGP